MGDCAVVLFVAHSDTCSLSFFRSGVWTLEILIARCTDTVIQSQIYDSLNELTTFSLRARMEQSDIGTVIVSK
jgi:hypothetical protein